MASRRDAGTGTEDAQAPRQAVTEMKLRVNPNIRVRLDEPYPSRHPTDPHRLDQTQSQTSNPTHPSTFRTEPQGMAQAQTRGQECGSTAARFDDPEGSAVRSSGNRVGECQVGPTTSFLKGEGFPQAQAPGSPFPRGAGTPSPNSPQGVGAAAGGRPHEPPSVPQPSADPFSAIPQHQPTPVPSSSSSPGPPRGTPAPASHCSPHGIGGLGITALHPPERPSQAGSSLGQAGSPRVENQSLLDRLGLFSLFQSNNWGNQGGIHWGSQWGTQWGSQWGKQGGGWLPVSGGEPAGLGAGALEWEGRAEGRTLAGLTRGAPGDTSFGGGLHGLENNPPLGSRNSSYSRATDCLGEDSHEVDCERGSRQSPGLPGSSEGYAGGSPFWSEGTGQGESPEYMSFTRYLVPATSFLAVSALGSIAVLVLVALGAPALAIGAAAGAWALLLVLNLSLALLPRLSLRQAIRGGRRHTLRQLEKRLVDEPFLPVVLHGHVVQTSGALDAPGNMLSDQGAVVMETVLQQCGARHGRHFFGARTLVRQARAANFVIQDREGRRAAVRARCAGAGAGGGGGGGLTALVRHEDATPLGSSHRMTGFLDEEWLRTQELLRSQRPELQVENLVVRRGMIVEGQSVAVMGCLRESMNDPGNLVIEPLPGPVNATPWILGGGWPPFSCPVWVSGLVIADNPDSYT